MTTDIRQQIDAMPFAEMIRRLRTEPINSPFFTPENGRYFTQALGRKRAALDARVFQQIMQEVGQ